MDNIEGGTGEMFSAVDNKPEIEKLKDFGWLSNKSDRNNLTSKKYYKEIRSRIHEGFDEKVISFNELHALHILGRCNNPNNWEDNKQGLVYGMVQSGKTANMICLMGLANASGYNFMILLSSEKNSLRKQTQKRVNKAFKLNQWNGSYDSRDNDYQHIQSLTNIDSDYQNKTAEELHDYISKDKTIIVCIKKNIDILKNFVRNLKEIQERYPDDFNKIKSIIIDDEADFASINTSKIEESEQEDEYKRTTAINNKIKDIRKTINNNSYVQYTATPQACIAADPDSLVGYPKDFLWLLDVYKENGQTYSYLGHNEFFDLHKKELIHIVKDTAWPHYIKDEEGKVNQIQAYWGRLDKKPKKVTLKNVVDKTIKDFEQNDNIREKYCQDYKSAIMDFIITCSIRWFRHYKKKSLEIPSRDDIVNLDYPYHSMILNLAYEKKQLQKILRIIDKIFKAVKKDYYEEKILFHKKFEAQKIKSESFGMNVPSMQELGHFINLSFKISEEIIENEYIYLLYSGKGGQPLDYDSTFNTVKKAAIIIGGHSLSRGLTVENLSTSFFIRSQVQSLGDTNLQMCRWFGHKRKDIDLISVYLMEYSSKLYSDLSRADNLLRDEFKETIHINRPPECFLIALQNNHLFAATSPKKSQLLVKGYKSSYSDGKTKSIHYSICAGHKENDKKLSDFLENIIYEDTGNLGRNSRVYRNVNIEEFKSFFKSLKIPEDQIYTPINYLSYLDEYENHGIEIPPLNIAVFGYEEFLKIKNDNFYFKSFAGGSNKNNLFAGDKWIDMPKEFHKKYHSGSRQNKRKSGDSILISFYRFNSKYKYNVKNSELNLSENDKNEIEKGKNLPPVILYTITTPLGGPTYKVSHNKKRQEVVNNLNCLDWEEKNSIIKDE